MTTIDHDETLHMGAALELLQLLRAAGNRLAAEAEIACGQQPQWIVFVGEVTRIDLQRAPLDVVLNVVELRPGQALAMALPIDDLVRALDLGFEVGTHKELVQRIFETPPRGCCVCLVAIRHELLPIHLPRDGSLPAVLVGPAVNDRFSDAAWTQS